MIAFESPAELARCLLLHAAVPAACVLAFLHLRRRVAAGHRGSSFPLALVVATYGGWVLAVLNSVFWTWSGAASVGMAVLVMVSPWLLLWCAVRWYPQRARSTYHRAVFWASALYAPAVLLLVGLAAVG